MTRVALSLFYDTFPAVIVWSSSGGWGCFRGLAGVLRVRCRQVCAGTYPVTRNMYAT